MSRVSYFQRFSQAENHATNNTLLMLRHLYATGPARLERVLSDLLDGSPLDVGVTFNQQEVGKHSVLDAVIRQAPFEISFEAKRGGLLNLDQIRRHIESIADRAGRRDGTYVLVGLTQIRLADDVIAQCEVLAGPHRVTFVNVTFERLAEAIHSEIRPHESDLREIAEDYESFLADADLLHTEERALTVVPCGTSWNENASFGLYYEPSSRPKKRGRYLGLYRKKAVRLIGKVKGSVIGEVVGGTLGFTEQDGPLDSGDRARIEEVIAATPYYDLAATPHRYYLVDSFAETDILKRSPGGLWGTRKFDLAEDFDIVPGQLRSLLALAEALRGKEMPDRGGSTS